MHKQVIWFFLFLLAFWLGGCDQADSPNPDTQPTVVQTPTITPEPTLASTTVPLTNTTDISSIIIWIPATLDRAQEAQLSSEISLLNVAFPNIEIQVESKAVLGQGGILSYLRTGRNVAPHVLPDLVVLPTDQLKQAGTEGLIVPLDDLLTAEDQAALFPIGQSLGQIEGQWLGYPFILTDMMQAVYDSTVFTQTLPIEWDPFLALDPPPQILFSADGREGGLLLLQLYLSLTDEITNDSGQLSLDETVLATALTALDVAQNNGLLAEAMTTLGPSDNFWESYQNLPTGVAFVTLDNYLLNGARILPDTVHTYAIPSVSIPRATGYAFAISTLDTNEQAVVADLLAHLVAPDALSNWSYQNGYLPVRSDTLAAWPTNSVEVNLLATTLEQAIPYPVAVDSIVISTLSQAVYAVLIDNVSPQTAANNALSSINQP